jgi:hypothetical protein
LSQKFNVAGGEQIPSSVNVHDRLPRLYSFALYQLVELALLFLDWAELRGG